jgi:hypothetical protein
LAGGYLTTKKFIRVVEQELEVVVAGRGYLGMGATDIDQE